MFEKKKICAGVRVHGLKSCFFYRVGQISFMFKCAIHFLTDIYEK